jgi:G:T/U-mismatch repair DNA glycosylase
MRASGNRVSRLWLRKHAGIPKYPEPLYAEIWPWIAKQMAMRALVVLDKAKKDAEETHDRRDKRLSHAEAVQGALKGGKDLSPEDQKMLGYLAKKLGVSPQELAQMPDKIQQYTGPRRDKLKKLAEEVQKLQKAHDAWSEHYSGKIPKAAPGHAERSFDIHLDDLPYLGDKQKKDAKDRLESRYKWLIDQAKKAGRKHRIKQLKEDLKAATTLHDGGKVQVHATFGPLSGGLMGAYSNTPAGQFLKMRSPSADELTGEPSKILQRVQDTLQHELRHATQYNLGIVLGKPYRHKAGFPRKEDRSYEKGKNENAKKKYKAQIKALGLSGYDEYLLQDYEFYTWLGDEVKRFQRKSKDLTEDQRAMAYKIYSGAVEPGKKKKKGKGKSPSWDEVDPTGAIRDAGIKEASHPFAVWKEHAPGKWKVGLRELGKMVPEERPKVGHEMWKEFWDTFYEGGKKKVQNPNPKTKDQYPDVTANHAYDTSPKFRLQLKKEFDAWVAKQKGTEDPSSPSQPKPSSPKPSIFTPFQSG